MSPAELFRALRRRWYVLALALLLAAAGAYRLVLHPTQLYLSSAVVVLEPPVTGTQPNQLANLQPALATISYAVVQQLQSPAGAAELRDSGVHGSYQLIPRNSGTSATPHYLIPSLEVQAQLPDPAAANAAVRRVIEVYGEHLDQLQSAQGIAPSARMSTHVLVAPSAAGLYGTKSRGLAGVALLGTVGGTLGALWTDRWLLRRRRGDH